MDVLIYCPWVYYVFLCVYICDIKSEYQSTCKKNHYVSDLSKINQILGGRGGLWSPPL